MPLSGWRHPANGDDGAVTRTDVASREIAAAAATVFAALVEPEALVAWLPPEGMSGRFEYADIRPGGSFRMVLTYDDPGSAPGKSTADSDVVEAQVVEIVAGERVVWAVEFEADDPAYAGTMTMTWTLAPCGADATDVEIRAEHVPPGISPDDHAEGLASSLANLAAHVEHVEHD